MASELESQQESKKRSRETRREETREDSFDVVAREQSHYQLTKAEMRDLLDIMGARSWRLGESGSGWNDNPNGTMKMRLLL